jgi:hypothetical protein
MLKRLQVIVNTALANQKNLNKFFKSVASQHF